MTIPDLCGIDKVAGCITDDGNIYFKAADLLQQKKLKDLFPNYEKEYGFVKNNKDNNATYVDLSLCLDICIKQYPKLVRNYLQDILVPIITQTTTKIPIPQTKTISRVTHKTLTSRNLPSQPPITPSSQTIIPQSQQPPITPSQTVTPSTQTITPSSQTIIPQSQQILETKKRKREEDKEAKLLVIPNRDVELEKGQKKSKPSTKNKDTPYKNSKNKKQTTVSNNIRSIHDHFDSELKQKANIARMDLATEARSLIIPSSQKRSDLENSLENATKKSDDCMTTFAELSHQCNLQFAHVLYAHFLKHPKHIIDLLHAVQCSAKPHKVEKNIWERLLNIDTQEPPSLELQLKTKDELAMSHRAWKEVVFAMKNKGKANLQIITDKINGLVVDFFSFKQVKNGFLVSIIPLIEAIVKAHLHQMEVRRAKGLVIPKEDEKYHLHLPETLQIKLSMDGRELGNMRTVVITLQVLNLQTFGTQEPSAVFPIGMYVGEEENIADYIEGLAGDMTKLTTNGIVITEEKSNASLGISRVRKEFTTIPKDICLAVDFYWVSDLKSLSCLSKHLREEDGFCFKCNCKRKCCVVNLNIVRSDEEERDIGHSLPIKPGNIFFCVLHMDERISEYLMKMTLKSFEKEQQIVQGLKEIGGFNSFSFRASEIGVDGKEEFMAWESKEYSFMFTGPHCDRLMASLHRVLGFLKDSKLGLKYWKMWNGWKNIREWLYLSNEDLANRTVKEVQDFEILLRDWGELVKEIRTGQEYCGDYIHILVNHYYKMLVTIGSLVPLSGQAVEHSHKYDRFLMDRATSMGKKKKGSKHTKNKEKPIHANVNLPHRADIVGFSFEKLIDSKLANIATWNNLYQISQIMLKKFRILYLSFNAEDVTFKRLEKKPGPRIIEFWTRDISSILRKPLFKNEETSQENSTQQLVGLQPRVYKRIAKPPTPQNGEDIRDADIEDAGEVSDGEVEEMVQTVTKEQVHDRTIRSYHIWQDDAMNVVFTSDEEDEEEEKDMEDDLFLSSNEEEQEMENNRHLSSDEEKDMEDDIFLSNEEEPMENYSFLGGHDFQEENEFENNIFSGF